jgi:hypothetical protein
MKTCKKCGFEKSFDSFYKHKRTKDGFETCCKSCKRVYQESNSTHIKSQKKEYSEKNKVKLKEYKIKYKEENPERVKSSNIKYRENLKKDPSFKRKIYKPKKTIIYSLRKNIYNCISKSLYRKGFTKKSKSHEILGCSYKEFVSYLESKFENWMNWDNRGLYNGEFSYGWDIDHIIPLSIGKSEEEIIKLNHYTNLQPLCSKINRDIKRDFYR